MAKKPNKKILSWISLILSAAIFLFALFVFIISLTARSKNRQAEFFGYSFAIVVTNSMYPEIKAGDLIVVKSCDITEIEAGQNAVFIGLSGEFKDKYIVHRVVEIRDIVDDVGNKSGICLETWGINNLEHDEDYVYSQNFVGREIFHSTALGSIMSFLKEPTNWMYLLVIILAVSFGLKQVVKIIKIIKKKDKQEEAKAEISPPIGSEAIAETESQTEAKNTEANPLIEAKVEAEGENNSDSKTEIERETKTEAETETVAETETKAETEKTE